MLMLPAASPVPCATTLARTIASAATIFLIATPAAFFRHSDQFDAAEFNMGRRSRPMGPPTPESAVIANPSLSLLVIRVTELLTPPHYLTNAKRGYTQPSPRTRFEVLDARRSSPSGVCLLG